MMTLPASSTPLYSHSLPKIEQWLVNQGCMQQPEEPHCWLIEQPTWTAELCLEIDQVTVRYLNAGESGQDIIRAFKYSLSRQDIEAAVFAGP